VIMRRFQCALLAAVAVIGFASVASAAPPYNWTGFYFGGHVGYGWGENKTSVTPGGAWVGDIDWANVNAAATSTLKPDSILGGAQFGYNHQFNNILVGIEADFSYLALKKSYNSGNIGGIGLDPATGYFSVSTDAKTDWLMTLRPRLGFVSDTMLVYVTGGLAIAQTTYSQAINFLNAATIDDIPHTTLSGGANAGTVKSTNVGWAAGAGAELAFSKNWSTKVEYLHADLGSQSFNSSFVEPVAPNRTFNVSHSVKTTVDMVRLGLNYRF
jgi:outer membrane immunogenic protein